MGPNKNDFCLAPALIHDRPVTAYTLCITAPGTHGGARHPAGLCPVTYTRKTTLYVSALEDNVCTRKTYGAGAPCVSASYVNMNCPIGFSSFQTHERV